MKTAVAYIRVSTDSQDEYSPDAQKRLIKEYAKNNNMLLTDVFEDIGISGTKASKRPQFQEMIALSKQKDCSFDTILVWKFSRFARNQEESIVYKSMLKKNGIDVISVSEPMPNDVYGGLIERIIEWMDEYYSIRLSEEVKRGMTQKAMLGQRNGGYILGYNIVDGKLVINEEESKIIKYIFNAYAIQKTSLIEIARNVNQMGYRTKRGSEFENRTIKYILQNVAYAGHTRWSKDKRKNYRVRIDAKDEDVVYVKNTHEPIISQELFDLAQQRLANNHRKAYSRSSETVDWINGIIKCSNCGSSLASGGRANSLQCMKYSKGTCNVSHYLNRDIARQSIINQLKELRTSAEIEYTVIDDADNNINELEEIEKAIKSLDTKEKRIKDAYMNGIDTIDEYKSNKELLIKEREELQKRYKKCQTKINNSDNDETMRNNIKSVYDILVSDKASQEEKKDAINSIFDKIIYNKSEKCLDFYLCLNKSNV